eukprot:snap_masked-scaffold_4-processed-gene-18.16-mRNA-1 protein AED:0.75 eAED:0.77 QI:0/0/0/1/1/1/2/0/400
MFATSLVYLIVFVLHIALPATEEEGYVCNPRTGEILKYRLNGVRVLLVVLVLFCINEYFGIINFLKAREIRNHFWENCFEANVIGIAGSFLLYVVYYQNNNEVEAFSRCPTKDLKTRKKVATRKELDNFAESGFLNIFYYGATFNPRFNVFGRAFDLKMFLYLVGAVMLEINVSATVLADGLNTNIFLYGWMITHFVFEYLFFEEIHLYTYDLFAEKLGFKLFWGCTVFYPFFYAIGTLDVPLESTEVYTQNILAQTAILIVFYAGYFLTRGSNLQKFFAKKSQLIIINVGFNDIRVFTLEGGLPVVRIEQKFVKGSRILTSGFWGVSRHINYAGEIIQAAAIGLSTSHLGFLGLLYPLYYVALFVPRQIEDDKICKAKYGDAWDAYVKSVPYRIIPYVY